MMDDAGKFVLKTNKVKIKESFYLSDKILDILEETDTIDEEIAQKVKSGRTNEEKIDALLYYLKRRGQDSFHNFVAAVKTDTVNEMLVQDLEAEYMYYKTVKDLNGKLPKNKQIQDVLKDVNFNDIPASSSPSDSLTSLGPVRELRVQENLCTLYTQLKAHMTNANLRELSFASPKPVTFKMVIDLQEEYMRSVEDCYKVLGVNDKTKSLHSHIIDLKAMVKQLRNEVQEKDKVRNNLSHQYMKMENKNRELKASNSRMKKENDSFKEKVKELQHKIDEFNIEMTNLREKISELSEENKKVKHTTHCEVSTQTKQENLSKLEFQSRPCDPVHRRQRNVTGMKISDKPRPSRQSLQNAQNSPRKPTTENTRNIEEELKINPHVKFDRYLNPTKPKSTSNGSPLSGLCIGSVPNKVMNSRGSPADSTTHARKKYSPKNKNDKK